MSKIVVAIPVRNEAKLIGDCLRALALQQGAARADILLLVNNSSDDTAGIARGLQPTLPSRLHVIEHEFPPELANAGQARRMAMARAAGMTDPDGVLLTTDGDSCVAPDWLESNLTALAEAADVVCGRAVIDPLDALHIPAHLHDDDAREVAYGTALDLIQALLDPDPADPWPRHAEESGASIAVRRAAFLAAGGVPAVPSGEDRALVAALRRTDAKVRHDPKVWATVSGRTDGRAADGMADTIRRRLIRQDPHVDSAMEPVADRIRRILARRRLRDAWCRSGPDAFAIGRLAEQCGWSPGHLTSWLTLPHFGEAWAQAEAASPLLARRPVARAELHVQMRATQLVLARLDGTGLERRTAQLDPDPGCESERQTP